MFSTQILLGDQFSPTELVLAPGYYVKPFKFILPSSLPASFEHKYGHIQYIIEAKAIIPLSLANWTCKTFSVANTLELSEFSDLSHPFEARMTNTLYFGIFKSSPIEVIFRLPKSILTIVTFDFLI